LSLVSAPLSPKARLRQRLLSGQRAQRARFGSLLKLLQEQQTLKELKLIELKREIQKGVESGPPKALDIEDVISRGKQ
jgi:hypothetical protein